MNSRTLQHLRTTSADECYVAFTGDSQQRIKTVRMLIRGGADVYPSSREWTAALDRLIADGERRLAAERFSRALNRAIWAAFVLATTGLVTLVWTWLNGHG